MSSADENQRKHNIPVALTMRLRALADGSTDWHEWHQAGVLMFQLAMTQGLQIGQGSPLSERLKTLLYDTHWLFSRAMRLIPEQDLFASHAIAADSSLAYAFGVFVGNIREPSQPLSYFFDILRKLGAQHGSAAVHQRAITHSFLARAAWWMFMKTPTETMFANVAHQHEKQATRIFLNNAKDSPDGMQAYRSHCLAMSLIRCQMGQTGYHRKQAWPALKSALHHRDYGHAIRATVLITRGIKGELWLRTRNQTDEVYVEAAKMMAAIRSQYS